LKSVRWPRLHCCSGGTQLLIASVFVSYSVFGTCAIVFGLCQLAVWKRGSLGSAQENRAKDTPQRQMQSAKHGSVSSDRTARVDPVLPNPSRRVIHVPRMLERQCSELDVGLVALFGCRRWPVTPYCEIRWHACGSMCTQTPRCPLGLRHPAASVRAQQVGSGEL
jgi:hypothetical protein